MAYTEKQKIELINTICERISKGRSLRSVLTDEGMPAKNTFKAWVSDKDELLTQYTGAREDRADFIFEEMFAIADDGTNDFVKHDIGDGIEIEKLNTEHIQRSKLRIDTRKWALSKMNPKKYGEKLDLSSGDGSMTPIVGITFDKNDER